MERLDTGSGEDSLESTWSALAGRWAVATGLATALLALLADVPLHIACLRGALGWLGVLLIARVGGFFASREPDSATPDPHDASDPSTAPPEPR